MEIIKKSIVFIFCVIGVIFLSTYINNDSKDVSIDTTRPAYPNEWMYNQRAYPDNFINKQAINQSRLQFKNIMSTRSSQENDW